LSNYFLRLIAVALLIAAGVAPSAAADQKRYTNSIGVEFVLIPAGSFIMGCDPKLEKCEEDETPAHKVTIAKAFYMGKFEVTQAQWQSITGDQNARADPKTANNPQAHVSFDDAQAFIAKLAAKEKTTKYRLPTEAEWEYAARAGSKDAWLCGNDSVCLDRFAWYAANAKGEPRPVGQKAPNGFGLYDIFGNLDEWTADWYDYAYYAISPAADPKGASDGYSRVLRGGGYLYGADGLRSASRNSATPDARHNDFGFRLVLER
jgi:formylglycine-generating enzyme required for sulfatase activity